MRLDDSDDEKLTDDDASDSDIAPSSNQKAPNKKKRGKQKSESEESDSDTKMTKVGQGKAAKKRKSQLSQLLGWCNSAGWSRTDTTVTT